MAQKLTYAESSKFPRLYVRPTFNAKIVKQSKKQGKTKFEIGSEVIKAGLEELGY